MLTKTRIRAGKLAVGKISSRDEAVLNDNGLRVESVVYDFSEDEGAVGTINFGRKLPEGAIVTKIISDEITALTSGGAATLQLKVGSIDLTDALAFDTGFAGIDNQVLASSAEGIKVNSDSELNLDIAVAALTAGKVRFFVEYMLPND